VCGVFLTSSNLSPTKKKKKKAKVFFIKLSQYGYCYSEDTNVAGSQWLTPVILGTQEAEIRRIVV
jgi:hypothetical protein